MHNSVNSDHLLTNRELRKGFLGLYFGRIIMTISDGLLGVFLPIFLYNILDGDMVLVAVYFACGALAYLVLLPYGTQFLNKFGFRKALVLASLSVAALHSTYFFTTSENAFVFLPISVALIVIFRLLFWIPYHVDFAIFTNTGKRGGQIGLMLSTITLFGVVGPMIAGYVISVSSIQILFLVSVLIFILGAIPFALVPRTNEKFSWSYKKSWGELLSKKNRAVVWSSIALGAESSIGLIVWPIFIFTLLEGDYFKVGALSSFIVGVTVLIQYMFGRHLDKIKNKGSLLRTGSILYAIGWVIKMFVLTSFHVFIAGLYHNIAKVLTSTSYDAIYYELAADQGHYVDEYTVLHEMAIQVGKIIAYCAVVLLVLVVSLKWAFIIGAMAALALTTLSIRIESRV